MKRYAVLWKRGQRRELFDSASACKYKSGRVERILRVYRVTDKEGFIKYCYIDSQKRWWYPIDGSEPFRNKLVKHAEDVTERLACNL